MDTVSFAAVLTNRNSKFVCFTCSQPAGCSVDLCVSTFINYVQAVAYPGIFFRGGSTNSVEDRENGDLGAVAP
jgi:hypothetical protein